MDETPEEIYVLNRRVRLLQPARGFRTSLDSVMLAAACKAETAENILDLGCGVGGAGFCVLHRVPGARLTGIDIQDDHIDLARSNIALNQMENRARFECMDIRDDIGERFDHVICNPPYMEAGTHTPSPSERKAMAHGHGETILQDWLDAGFRALKSGGSFTIIHRADQADKIILGLGRRFGAVEIIPLWPRQGEQAKRLVIRAIKDRKSPATLHAGLVLHKADGGYTEDTENILRNGAPLL
jgi:tRNA1(Val) A37 N6-methylase TrmN6